MTSRFPRAIVRAPRRARTWAQSSQNGSIAAATHAGAIAFNLLTAYEADIGAELHNVTVSAINFNVNYRLTSSTTGDDFTVFCGIILMGEDAFTVGGTSLPDPASDHADWMFWDNRTLSSSRDVTDIDEQVQGSLLRINNRSMRKMRENHQVLAMIFRATVLQPTTVQVFIGGRTLILLP